MALFGAKILQVEEVHVYPEKEAGYRLVGLLCGFLIIFSLSLTAVTIRDNVLGNQFHKMMQSVYKLSADYGMLVDDIIVEGNQRTSYDELVEALSLSENESILGVDIEQLQRKIEQLTWVKSCVIKRTFFPNNIIINIEERKVRAIWQYEERYYPVDEEGNVIEVEDYEPDAPLLLLAGEGAPNHLAELLKVLDTDKELATRVRAAVFISGRRWNLIFDNPSQGIVVKLPEENFDKAYQKIALLNKKRGIFKRKLTSFDLRYDNRIIVDIDSSVVDLMFKK